MPQHPRRFLCWLLATLSCWLAIRSLGDVAGGWPWPDDRPRTILVTLVLALLIAGLFVSLANLLAEMYRPPDSRKPRRS